MERKLEQETADFQPKRGNPANETVTYKIGGHTLKCLPHAAALNRFLRR